ncbi:2-iminobutanoate/2-iminopropanoate deaminase [Lachnellula hyalina]|uniref:2-iminobutanoate/2-iminopropanoate deaminase n=1 Tax=Lachnellula hyalina TaxID=1316788 RepID=A0A8H8QVC6_9HELO|nr:2-iminobutanoate/2-iminopropanoate deaminase [Lachnellula hyalina]TVY23388.1 2-iminobutanoate/2-iminopropanoate deaminase [Lachnellula hyalina]
MATPVFSKEATVPIGPYSQGFKTIPSTPLVWVSGQIHAGISGNLIEGTIAEQTAACLKNLVAVLTAAGSSLEKVFKVTIFLADMSYFAEMNTEYAKWFVWERNMPVRSCVAVKQLPKGARVETEAVAQG